MRRSVDLLAASALVLCLAATGVAAQEVTYQQSSVDNQQSQTGDVLATGNLNVIDVDDISSTTTATGNGYSASVETGSLGVASEQWVDANITANNTVTVRDYAGQTNMLTAATGNSGDVNSLYYGDVQADVSQAVNTGRSVTATGRLVAASAEIGDASIGAQAIANSHAFGIVGGETRATVEQYSGAITQATTEGQFRYSQGSSTFSAAAMSNNLTVAGVEGSDQKYNVKQAMSGDRTQASVLVGAANAQEINGTATAVANNITASNEYNPFETTSDQFNGGYVRAEADMFAYDFGAASANAYGVGNSVVAGNLDADLTMNVNQTNTGAVQSFAKFEGNGGYDAYASSVSMGNAATGYACSSCANSINIVNRQANSNLVTANTTIGITGSNRSVTGVATAIGNSATYYVSARN